jgi:uncharacterized membrane protein
MNQRPLSSSLRSWLLAELDVWQAGGIVSEEQSGKILDLYETTEGEGRRQRSLAIFTICSVAALMIGLAVLLLVGYNWQSMSPAVKLTILFGTLLGSYVAGFHLRYRKQWLRMSEVVFFLSGIFYGVAIWLIAQIFNIQAHYPDGLWFWALGVLPFALCFDTVLLHVLYVALLAIWVGTEVIGFPIFRPWFLWHSMLLPNGAYSLLLLALPGVIWAYRKRSMAALGLYVPLLGWWAVLQPVAWHSESAMVFLIGLVGSIMLLTAQAHGAGNRMAVPYRVWGILITGGILVPLSFSDFLIELLYANNFFSDVGLLSLGHPMMALPCVFCLIGVLAIGAAIWVPRRLAEKSTNGKSTNGTSTKLVASSFSASAHLQRLSLPIAMVVLFVAMSFWFGAFYHSCDKTYSSATWSAMQSAKWTAPVFVPMLAVNAMMVVFSLWLMRQGLHTDRGLVFTAGVLYFLLWTLLRYCDLFANIGGMLGASLMFLLCGVGLFAFARFWQHHKENGHA